MDRGGADYQKWEADFQLDWTLFQMSKHSPLAEFRDFINDFKSLPSWVVLCASSGPLIDLYVQFGSPWPSSPIVCIVSTIVELLVLILAYEVWRKSRTPFENIRLWMILGIIGFVISLVFYIILWSYFIVPNDDRFNRDVIGYEMHLNVRDMVAQNPSILTPEQLLRKFDRDVEAIWTSGSIKAVRVMVFLSWLAVWANISLALAAFVSLQYRRAPKKKQHARKPKKDAIAFDDNSRESTVGD